MQVDVTVRSIAHFTFTDVNGFSLGKVNAIKYIQDLTNRTLKEAKDYVEFQMEIAMLENGIDPETITHTNCKVDSLEHCQYC